MNENEEDIKKYDVFSNLLHKYSQKIYELWREILSQLHRDKGDKFLL